MANDQQVLKVQRIKERLRAITIELEDMPLEGFTEAEVAALGSAETAMHAADMALVEFT
jgi:hypothetical protein